MNAQKDFTLINPQNGNLVFKLFAFEGNSYFDHIQRNNYYSLVWLKRGTGKVKAELFEYDVMDNSLFAFSPYQPFMITEGKNLSGSVIQFHSDFFCIQKHQKEVACNGILFNNIYEPPVVYIDDKNAITFSMLMERMTIEMKGPALAQHELLTSYLKIFLITASRMKTEQAPQASQSVTNLKEPFILQDLKDTIEKEYKTKHSASDYAKALNISVTALAKITKAHFNKTLTDLISERIVIEAKRELYLTNKAVKEIAYELGYNDEYYFSRFFKTNTGISPQLYRDTVGFGRGS